MNAGTRLRAEALRAHHGAREVLKGIDLALPAGGFTVIVGPNACGKSTLLRSLARLHRPSGGTVLLDGLSIARYRPRDRARLLAVLPQGAEAPEGITVVDLVARGRHPHRSLFQPWTAADQTAVETAMVSAGVSLLAERRLESLSGGQRQKAWIAMALAQGADILLLDEPTTFLDLAHQIDVLELCVALNRAGTTIVAVLHDLNQAARYASRLVVMRAGEIVAQGLPEDLLTPGFIDAIFHVPCIVMPDPLTGKPLIVPKPVPPSR
ncbi:ABC transporter ATP-binding protein [Bosea minatitlanensis]|uniref:ABC transporter ATP-binding protein n=1 Tax=Bosea minatitlanensis TaxID=128782 RepID=A0ABW0EWF9_9HYPH|nr:ABC transporter ATP-binding protein [Bosea minatitlanensis]MCT4495195.1 ABC transporter ATP-binding protein [Bosea minatitlanensis]